MSINILHWLLEGDISISYQVARDLAPAPRTKLLAFQRRIEHEGWALKLLSCRNPNGHWGKGAYQPKWTSTHYTLLELRDLGLSPRNIACRESTGLLLANRYGKAGGINLARSIEFSDVCVNGMLLNIAGYFTPHSGKLRDIVDFLLHTRMPDGGWNCEYRKGARHSSLHTTVSVLEGLDCYLQSGNSYRTADMKGAIREAIEFLLRHRLFRSHRTGAIIDRNMLRLSFPPRWRYDVLRGLDCMRSLGCEYDERMQEAIDLLISKRRNDGRWPLQSPHKGRVHFQMERVGQPSRWNTLRSLRVLTHFGIFSNPLGEWRDRRIGE
jgi:hypothetical protein